MRLAVSRTLLFVLLALPPATATGADQAAPFTLGVAHILPRTPSALSGSAFAESLAGMDDATREAAVLTQLMEGNLPDFLRTLKPVRLIGRSASGKTTTATIFVMPDYLAIGSDDDFLRMPMRLSTATEIATQFHFLLPTRKMVDAIFAQADFRLAPEPLPPGPEMRSTEYYLQHNRIIEEQRQAMGAPLGDLMAGLKKDLVLTNRLTRAIGKVAIYGWHRPTGIPIQPLSTVHGARYADYSHGIRLVSDTMLIDGEPRSVYAVLEDPRLAPLVSDEGPIRDTRELMSGPHP
ncbi:MAG TPA: hypothetical protein VN648_29970 [Candidatus Methylomirabilis sp.]|nr:hypothetical protein [Candidatus Methylomirabilis sp.]